jgi:hypothetical protein
MLAMEGEHMQHRPTECGRCASASAADFGDWQFNVSEDDLRAIAKRGYEDVGESLTRICQSQALGLFISDVLAARPAGVTALRRSQRRFSNGVTTVATPFHSSGKWHRSSSAAGRGPAGRCVSNQRPS